MRRLNQLSTFSRILEYSTELGFNANLPNLIDLNIAFYMHLIRELDSVHVKCDV